MKSILMSALKNNGKIADFGVRKYNEFDIQSMMRI